MHLCMRKHLLLWMHLLKFQNRFYQRKKILGELQLPKSLPNVTAWHVRQKKNQNQLTTPAEKNETENLGSEVHGYLLLGIGGLAVSALGVYYQREAIMATLRGILVPEPQPSCNLQLMD